MKIDSGVLILLFSIMLCCVSLAAVVSAFLGLHLVFFLCIAIAVIGVFGLYWNIGGG